MKKFKVIASSTSYYFTEIEAENENEAFAQAKQLEGDEFTLDYWGDNWKIEEVTQC